MEARSYLLGIREYREKKDRFVKQLDDLKLDYKSMTGIDYSKSKVQTTPKNSMEEAAWNMLKKLERIQKKVNSCNSEIAERLDVIERITPSMYRNILFKVYSEYKSLQEVSIDMNYSYNYCCSKHSEALRKVNEEIR